MTPVGDYLSEDGARSLCARIMAYWATRGFVVVARPVKITQRQGFQFLATWGIVSDMVDGLPANGARV